MKEHTADVHLPSQKDFYVSHPIKTQWPFLENHRDVFIGQGTENGIIFGNIVYDIAGSTSDRNVVVLNDIHIDIMDYIVPASCTETEFRSMWAEFEWENKVAVSTHL